jgi:hypothetical protein
MKMLITAPTTAMAAVAVALAFPVIASAQAEWDIGAYDQCVNSGENQLPDKPNAQEDHIHYCCLGSGGIWNAAAKKCVAPPAEQAQGSITRGPGDLPVHVFEPDRPTTRVVDVIGAPVLTAAG